MSKTLEKPVAYKSPLHEMTQTTPTCLWNDSATLSELTYSIEHGAVGATCNPVIVLDALKKEAHLWNDRIRAIAKELPTATEEDVGWKLVEEISAKRSELLLPVFAQYQGRNGRLSISPTVPPISQRTKSSSSRSASTSFFREVSEGKNTDSIEDSRPSIWLTQQDLARFWQALHDRPVNLPSGFAATGWRRRGADSAAGAALPKNQPENGKIAAKKTQPASRIAGQASKRWNDDQF